MKKYFHKKLVRDKIPKLITSLGGKFETRVLNAQEFEKELKKKLLEEAKEVALATKDNIRDELAHKFRTS